MNNGSYTQAQICENGHVTNEDFINCPESNQKFCTQCGAKTITTCPQCTAPIRGTYIEPCLIGSTMNGAPDFCYNCGEPYPWTKVKLDTIQEILKLEQEQDNISCEDVAYLEKNIATLTADGPKTQLVAMKFKNVLNKIKGPSYQILHDILVDVGSETLKKVLFSC